jgi:hypothetical protein
MPTKKDLLLENIIIVANTFNPSIFSSLWLVKHKFLTEQEILPNSLSGPEVSQIFTNDFILTVIAPRLDYSFSKSYSGDKQNLASRLSKIIQKLPEVPYNSAGINFEWIVSDEEKGIESLSRELFFHESSRIFRAFDTKEAQFGGFASMNIGHTRLKLNMVPGLNVTKESRQNVIRFSFNFHQDITQPDRAEQIARLIGQWNEFYSKAKEIMSIVE